MPGVILAAGDEMKAVLTKAKPNLILVPSDVKAMIKQQPAIGFNIFLIINNVDGICGYNVSYDNTCRWQ